MKERITKAFRATVAYLGPVAGAIEGELCKEERQRVLVKAAVMGCVSGVPVWTSTDASFLTDFVVPIGAAGLTAFFDAKRRLKHGEPTPPPAVEPPPVSQPEPPPSQS